MNRYIDIGAVIIIIVISISLGWYESDINEKSNINAVGTLSATGTLIIAYFSCRALTTVFENRSSEAEFNRVVNLIEYLEKLDIQIHHKHNGAIHYDGSEKYKPAWTDIFELSGGYYRKKIDIEIVTIQYKDYNETLNIESFKLNKLNRYKYNPLVPKNIKEALCKMKRSNNDINENVNELIEIVDSVNDWFVQKGL